MIPKENDSSWFDGFYNPEELNVTQRLDRIEKFMCTQFAENFVTKRHLTVLGESLDLQNELLIRMEEKLNLMGL